MEINDIIKAGELLNSYRLQMESLEIQLNEMTMAYEAAASMTNKLQGEINKLNIVIDTLIKSNIYDESGPRINFGLYIIRSGDEERGEMVSVKEITKDIKRKILGIVNEAEMDMREKTNE